jgi:hypothetical protein
MNTILEIFFLIVIFLITFNIGYKFFYNLFECVDYLELFFNKIKYKYITKKNKNSKYVNNK